MADDIRQHDSSGGVVHTATEALIEQCQNQSANCLQTATGFHIWLRWLRGLKVVLVGAPIIFGGLATWSLLTENQQRYGYWIAVFTLLATVLPPLYRALRIDQSIKEYRRAAAEFTNLRHRLIYASEVSSKKPFADFEADVKPTFDQLDRARQHALTPPQTIFYLARREIKKGNYDP